MDLVRERPASSIDKVEVAAALVCADVSFTYPKGEVANDDVNFSIAAGELFCLLGPNGAGKTTLVAQIVGELMLQYGDIEVCGRSVARGRAKGLIGVVPQKSNLFEGLSVREHLTYFAQLKGLRGSRIAIDIARIADDVDLTPLMDRRVGKLSGGEQRRVLLALAMLGDPPLLILDEPTVGLDPISRDRVWACLRRMRDAGRAILLTTHHLEEAEALADRVGFLVGGRLRRLGRVAELSASLGKAIRVQIAEPEGQVLYFGSRQEAHAYVQSHDIMDYALGPTSLRDIYGAIVSEESET